MSTAPTPSREVVLAPGEGKTIEAQGARLTVKASSADTGGAYALVDYVAPPHYAGPPPHVHRATDEAFFVLEGQLTVRLGERTVEAGPGAFVQVARSTVHTFANHGDVPARFVGVLVPGGFEGYYEELPGLIARHGYPPPPAVMAELARRYDVAAAPSQPT
jgi:mannose-6-phosphate isomerase-like protein (cupin superfamily)